MSIDKPLFLILFSLLIAFGIAIVVDTLFRYIARRNRVKWAVEGQYKVSILEVLTRYFANFTTSKSAEIEEKFIAAGIYNTKVAPYWFFIKYSVILAVVGLTLLLTSDRIDSLSNIALISVLVAVLVTVPDLVLRHRRKILSEKITRQLPYLLDLMAVCVQTGMTIESAIFYLTKEMAGFDRDLSYVLKRLSDRAQIVGMEKGLEELLERVPSNEMRSFVHTLSQSMKYGTSIHQVIITLAKDIREVQLLTIEEKVGKLSSKMSIPLILFIMFPVVILITAPGIMRLINGEM